MPEEFFFNETSDPAKLNNRQRGQLAELGFMRKAASLGLSIAKPWNEGERYDFIARVEKVCWRIQVKSVWAKQPQRNYYRFTTSSRSGLTYSADEIDFVLAYIFGEDTWYVLPVREVENRKSMCVMPGSKRSRYEQYREAWKLMKPACVQPAAVADVPRTRVRQHLPKARTLQRKTAPHLGAQFRGRHNGAPDPCS